MLSMPTLRSFFEVLGFPSSSLSSSSSSMSASASAFSSSSSDSQGSPRARARALARARCLSAFFFSFSSALWEGVWDDQYRTTCARKTRRGAPSDELQRLQRGSVLYTGTRWGYQGPSASLERAENRRQHAPTTQRRHVDRYVLLFHCGFFFAALDALRLLSFTCFLRLARSFVDRLLLVSGIYKRAKCANSTGKNII